MRKKSSGRKLAQINGYGLRGRIVTMKNETDIIADGIIYINNERIAAIIKKGDSVPESLQQLPVYKTNGTIFPGLIELHNHLSYNCLPLWNVPKVYGNRSQWAGIPEYKQLISGPMYTLGKTPGYPEAIVRYVECKCLMAGVTTSQGIMLYSNAGIQKYYRGIVRNVEESNNPGLPRVNGHIPDIASKDAAHFLKQLKKNTCLLLHLSEGSDKPAHKHFEALKINETEWAITDSFAGIHCVALNETDYQVLQDRGASMVWSPLSNLLLYGQTADVRAAKKCGIKIGIGSDWSSSGSKNLLGELKIAKIYSTENDHIFSDYEIVAMATVNASKIIKWDKEVGTLEQGKRADLLVVKGTKKDAYDLLLNASEKMINLVVIDGVPRYGLSRIMKNFGKGSETRRLARSLRTFNLDHSVQDPVIGKLKLSDAEGKLKFGLKNLKKLAKELPKFHELVRVRGKNLFMPKPASRNSEKQNWFLVLDQDESEGQSIRPHLPIDNQPTMMLFPASIQETASLVSETAIKLDRLTVSEDKDYFNRLDLQKNLPSFIKEKIKTMYKDSV